MTTQSSHRPIAEAIVPDAVFAADGTRRASLPRPGETRILRQLRWIDRVMLVLAATAVILVASIVAVGAAVVLAVLFVVAAIVGAGRSIATKVRR